MTRSSSKRFLLLYGSQTGQAKAIAEEIQEKAENHGLHADMFCLSLTEKKFWLERETCVVIVTSTTGEGEPPDTALKFWRRLKKKTLSSDHLSKLNYALLGLGDSNYTNFCNCSKNLDRRLQELGAKRFCASGFADDAVGLEVVVEPWMEGLWPALKEHLGVDSNGDSDHIMTGSAACADTDTFLNKSTHSAGEKLSQGNVTETTVAFNDIGLNDRSELAGEKCLKSAEPQNSYSNRVVNGHDETEATTTESNGPATQDDTDSSTQISHQVSTQSGPPSESTKIPEQKAEDTLIPNIRHSLPPLSESALNLPVCPPCYLNIEFQSGMKVDLSVDQLINSTYPSAASQVVMATVVSSRQISRKDAVKRSLEIELDIQDTSLTYKAGDSFGIICPNNENEVSQLLHRLDMQEKAHCPFTLSVIEGTKKKSASLPEHIPSPSTLHHTLLYCCDIRTPPKKTLLRTLVEHTSDAAEKRRLQELCSRQGAAEYSRCVRESSLSLLDLLTHFPSCQPPISLLMEHLPRLQPRPYSTASCLEACPGRLHFVFNVVDIPADSGRTYPRHGVCTGWLEHLTTPDTASVTDAVQALTISPIQIPIYARSNHFFRLPEDGSVPVVMIGPGTGVAPFIGFLQQRKFEKSQIEEPDARTWGEMWLLFGCRHKDKDYLYRSELKTFVTDGVLDHLLVSFSRDEQDSSAPRYVQDNMRQHASALCDVMCKPGSRIYVCGDARGMAPQVNETWLQIMQEQRGWSKEECISFLTEKRKNKEYLEDVWA